MVQPYIMEEYSQDTFPEFFVEISNLYREIENGNGNEDIRVYHYNRGKTLTCLYILIDRFHSSRNEITEFIDQLYMIAEDAGTNIRGNSNGSTHVGFQINKAFLNDDLGATSSSEQFQKIVDNVLCMIVMCTKFFQP